MKRKETSLQSKKINYAEMLKATQEYVSHNYSGEISGLVGAADAGGRMKKIIVRSLINLGYYAESDAGLDDAAGRLYEDMSGYSILSKYLADPDFEEANINSWDCIIIQKKGRRFIAPETFLSPEFLIDTVKNMIEKSGEKIDESIPKARASLSDNTRMIAIISPIVKSGFGAAVSIRRVNAARLSEADLIASNTATPEIIDFLFFCISHGVSVCFAGETGSGKTTTANWLLTKIPYDRRIITIEEGSPEFENLLVYDESGKPKNDVVFLRAKNKGSTPEQIISPIKLLDSALWMDPDIIVVGEMRSSEAYTAQEAARTGHVVVTTTHSNSAKQTYDRMMTLAQLYPGNRLNEDMMMSLMVKAFPIIVYMKDRRIMEVMEGEGYMRETGLKSRTIFRFNVESNRKIKGRTVIKGRHEHVCGISENLAKILFNNGAENKKVEKYMSFKGEG